MIKTVHTPILSRKSRGDVFPILYYIHYIPNTTAIAYLNKEKLKKETLFVHELKPRPTQVIK